MKNLGANLSKNKKGVSEVANSEIVSIKKLNKALSTDRKDRYLSFNKNNDEALYGNLKKDPFEFNIDLGIETKTNSNQILNISKSSPLSNNLSPKYKNSTSKNHITNTSLDKTLYPTQSLKRSSQNISEALDNKKNLSEKLFMKSWSSINKIFTKRNQGYYCPHCEHCNNIKDENLDKYIAMKDAKNIIKKGFEYICEYYENDQSFLDFLLSIDTNKKNNNVNNKLNVSSLSGGNNPQENMNYISSKKLKNYSSRTSNEFSKSHYPDKKNNKNFNMNIFNADFENIKNNKKSNKFDIDNLLITYPKINVDRNVLQLVTHFLDAIVKDKVSLDTIITPEIFDKLKNSLIAQGMAFKAYDYELEFDQEIELLFDEFTKAKIKKLFKSIVYFIYIHSIAKFKQIKSTQSERKIKHEEEMVVIRKRFMVLFL